MAPRLLLFGSTGRSGGILARAARAQGRELVAPTHDACPLENRECVSETVLNSGAELVINAAAVSGLESCAEDPLHAHLVNAVAPAAMALACRHTGARFIHLSTDYVLDGRRPGLKAEDAHCAPLSVYAASKREGELQVAEALPAALIVRVSWICGNPEKPSFIEQTLRRALHGEPLAAIADQYSLPTDAEDMARILLAPQAAALSGVVQLCADGEPLSRHRCAELVLREALRCGALPTLPSVEPLELARVPFFREPRPRHTAMSHARLATAGFRLPSADECIATVVRRALPSLTPIHT
ncbi:MAG: SDR family oxidoreductase [Akkermansia sp.]